MIDVTFTQAGSLGIVFNQRKTAAGRIEVFVHELAAGSQSVTHEPTLKRGLVLSAVQGHAVEGLALKKLVTAHIAPAGRPLTLGFSEPKASSASASSSAGRGAAAASTAAAVAATPLPEPELAAVVQIIQRDINRLNSDDRSARKSATAALKGVFLRADVLATPGALDTLLGAAMTPLVRRLHDQVERCRADAIELFRGVLPRLASAASLLETVLPEIKERIGSKTVEEPSEEVRLLLVQFVRELVETESLREPLASYTDKVVEIVGKMLTDPYADIKRECCLCVDSLHRAVPELARHHAPSLARSVLENTGHQHSKVRAACVRALGTLVSNGAEVSFADLEPQLRKLSRDRASSVREAMADVGSTWLQQYVSEPTLNSSVLALLLSLASDNEGRHSAVARDGIQAAGVICAKRAQLAEPNFPLTQEGLLNGDSIGWEAQLLVRDRLAVMMPITLQEVEDWTQDSRFHATRQLHTMLAYAGDESTQHLTSLLPTMYHAIADDVRDIVTQVISSVEMLGVSVASDAWMPLVLGDVHNHALQDGGVPMVHCIRVLSALMNGLRAKQGPEALSSHLDAVSTLLADPLVRGGSTVDGQLAVLEAAKECAEVASAGCSPESQVNLFIVLLQLASWREHAELTQQSVLAMARMAEVLGFDSIDGLYQAHFTQVLETLTVCDRHKRWTWNSPGRCVFDVLVRGGGGACAPNMDAVLAIFAETLDPEREAELRLGVLVLLDTMCSNPALHDALRQERMLLVLTKMVQPNLVWKVGRVSGKVRKGACTVLRTIARNNLGCAEEYMFALPKLLPPLLSAMDDDFDVGTRQVACDLLEPMFATMAGQADEQSLKTTYEEVLKRLDDNSDEVRIAATRALSSVLLCIEPLLPGGKTLVEYMASTLLIHLDDTEAAIRDAVLPVLLKAAELCPEKVMAEAQAVQHRFRPAGLPYIESLLRA